MRGHIRTRGKGIWALIVDLGRDENGKRQQQWQTFKGNKKDAEGELARIIVALERGDYVRPQKITVGEYLQQWLKDYAAVHCSGKTAHEYRKLIETHIIPRFGKLLLTKLAPAAVDSFYSHLLTNGRLDGKGGLAPNSVLRIHGVLHEALARAVKLEYVARNVTDAVEKPKAAQEEIQALDEAQSVRLLAAAEGTRLYLPILVAVCAGLRRGEILALRWSDVDLMAGVLMVNQATQQIPGSLTFKVPKSKRSRRPVSLPSMLVEELVRHKGHQAQQKLLLGPAYDERGLVCSQEDGALWSPGSFSHQFAELVKKANVPRVTFHALRHSHVSQLIKSGVDIKTVSARVGHSSASFTLDRYGHLLDGQQEDAARRIDAALRKAMEG